MSLWMSVCLNKCIFVWLHVCVCDEFECVPACVCVCSHRQCRRVSRRKRVVTLKSITAMEGTERGAAGAAETTEEVTFMLGSARLSEEEDEEEEEEENTAAGWTQGDCWGTTERRGGRSHFVERKGTFSLLLLGMTWNLVFLNTTLKWQRGLRGGRRRANHVDPLQNHNKPSFSRAMWVFLTAEQLQDNITSIFSWSGRFFHIVSLDTLN